MVSCVGPVTAEQVNAVESYREKWAEFATFGPILTVLYLDFPSSDTKYRRRQRLIEMGNPTLLELK